MTTGLVARLANFGCDVRRTGLAPERAHRIAGHVRDIVGIALAAGADWSDDPVTRVARGWGGPGVATPLGRSGRMPAAHAALIGGTLAHAIDFDDTHLPSVLHPSASVVPAALAVSEAVSASGAELVAAVAVGDEICCRLGMAGYNERLRNSIFFEHGQHATAICGAVGAAAACALISGLEADEVAHAMAIATSFGSGVLEANRTGGMVKRVHCGWAAHAGVAAAELAAAGLTGPPTAIEGRFGFLWAHCRDEADVRAVDAELGERWEIDSLHIKPYPANHFTHAVIDAALQARAAGFTVDDVDAVEVGLAAPVLRTVAEPLAAKAAPPDGYVARFSAPWVFAAALQGGGGLGLGIEDFSDTRAHDPVLRAVAGRVRCVADERCDSIFPHSFPAIVRVHATSGRDATYTMLDNRGSPGRPLSDKELSRKFRDCASRALSPAEVAALDRRLARLLELDDVRGLTDPESLERV